MEIRKFLRIWGHNIFLAFEDSMAYKGAFFVLLISLFFGDILIPVVSAIIYSVSAGIPGWTLYEFVLFQGTLILVMGIWHSFFAGLLGNTIGSIQEGTFDKILLKPFPALAFLTADGFDTEGPAEAFAGAIIVTWALIKIHFFNWMLLAYLGVILLAVLFEYSITIIAASFAFIFTKSWRLFDLIETTERFSRYPLDIYGLGFRFVLTFIIPAAVASYYPAAVLLGKEPLLSILLVAIPIIIFFSISLLLWSLAMRKYSSAGG